MKYYEDFEVSEKQSFGNETLSREEIIEFAEQYDPQLFQTDPEAAKDSMFGGLIASGWHTTAVTIRLLVENIFTGTAFRGAIGIDELRWKQPVYPEDSLSVEAEILDKEPYQGSLGLIRGGVGVTNQEEEEVMSFTGLLLFETKISD